MNHTAARARALPLCRGPGSNRDRTPYELARTSLMRIDIPEDETAAMSWTRFALIALTLAAFLVACGRVSAASGTPSLATASPTTVASASPTASPEFHPGPNSLSGRVVRLVPSGVVIEAEGREVEVNLGLVVDVWKETSVPASALEVGDDLFVNGTGGSPFVARYVYANIGRIDGVIRAIDATGMDVEVLSRTTSLHVERIDFSAYVEFGAPAAGLKVTRADLVVGRTIGAVVYRPRVGPLRATRIW